MAPLARRGGDGADRRVGLLAKLLARGVPLLAFPKPADELVGKDEDPPTYARVRHAVLHEELPRRPLAPQAQHDGHVLREEDRRPAGPFGERGPGLDHAPRPPAP